MVGLASVSPKPSRGARSAGSGRLGAKEGSSRSLEEGLANVANLSRDSIQYTEMVGE